MSDITLDTCTCGSVVVSDAQAVADLKADNERLRAALEPLACTCDRANGAACSRAEANCAFWNARAALEGRT